MLKYDIKVPKKFSRAPALVIGLPGLLELREDNRVKRMLEDLNQIGYHTLLFDYANITESRDGKLLECRPDLSGSEITRIAEDVRRNIGIPNTRTALIANSIGAIPATRHLIKTFPNQPAVYSLISPLPGWQHFLNADIRKSFEEGTADISVSTPLDKQRGIKRIIPRDFIPELMKIDCLEELSTRGYQPNGNMTVVTILGKKDEIASPDAMIKHHESLGGTTQTLTQCNSGHDVPGTDMYITDAIKTKLPLAQRTTD